MHLCKTSLFREKSIRQTTSRMYLLGEERPDGCACLGATWIVGLCRCLYHLQCHKHSASEYIAAFCPGIIIVKKCNDFNDCCIRTKCLWITPFRSEYLERFERRVNDIEFILGVEDFYYGLLSSKCHDVVTIVCFIQTCANAITCRNQIREKHHLFEILLKR